jgi:predicted kinase
MDVDEPTPAEAGQQQAQQQQQQKQVLLLLKGHPATGKSALARRLAAILHWPVVDKDDARDCLEASLLPVPSSNGNNCGAAPATMTSSGGGATGASGASPQPPAAAASAAAAPPSPPPPAAAAVVAPRVLNDLSYDIMFRVAASQLACGLSAIVDCPLARRELYERASALAGPSGAAVVVVECVPASEEAWREALDTRVANAALESAPPSLALAGVRGSARHKPRSWEALQQLVGAYGGASEWTAAAGAGAGGAGGAGGGAEAASPSRPAPAVVPHYLSVRTLRRANNGGAGPEAATRAAADEVVSWLRRRGLCSAAGGAGAAARADGDDDAAAETVEIPVQGSMHMPAIAE